MLHDDTVAALSGASCTVAVAPHGYAAASPPIKTIGVGYDASPESTAAIDFACALAARLDARVQALTVAPLPPGSVMQLAVVDYEKVFEENVAAARTSLESWKPVEGDAVAGVPSQELAAFGDQVDLLVVGSRGYGPIRRLMFGSTARKLASAAPCPLLVLS